MATNGACPGIKPGDQVAKLSVTWQSLGEELQVDLTIVAVSHLRKLNSRNLDSRQLLLPGIHGTPDRMDSSVDGAGFWAPPQRVAHSCAEFVQRYSDFTVG